VARREYTPASGVLAQVRSALDRLAPGEVDCVTFVGAGEPTLHSRLGWLIREVRRLTELPIAVITNGTLLHRAEVRRELAEASIVMPTMDSGTPRTFRRMGRPPRGVTHELLVEGLVAFRREFPGRLWVEVMLVRGLNDAPRELRALRSVLDRVGADDIQLNVPRRPPAEPWVRPPPEYRIARAAAVLGAAPMRPPPAEAVFRLNPDVPPEESLLDIIRRHPLGEDELSKALEGMGAARAHRLRVQLRTGGKAKIVERGGRRFWCPAESRHPPSRRAS
jgi:hypothetical protein